MLEVTSEQISRLTDKDAVNLLRMLLYAEARKYQIIQSCNIHVPEEINIPDGGEDGYISWQGNSGTLPSEWLPTSLTTFQVKASKMEPAKCKAEIFNEKTKKLKPKVKEILEQSGTYILFCTKPIVRHGMDPRLDNFREALQIAKSAGNLSKEVDSIIAETGKLRDKKIKIYDSNKIAAWVNNHFEIIISVYEWTNDSLPNQINLRTWEEWSQDEYFQIFQYISNKHQDSLINKITSTIFKAKQIVRITGLAGIGKTRCVLEAFRKSNTKCVYIEHPNGHLEEICQLIDKLRRKNVSGVLVVDNCQIEAHKKLKIAIRRGNSQLSLITINYEPDFYESNPNSHLLGRMDDESMELLFKQYSENIDNKESSLNDKDIKKLVDFCKGFPAMLELINDNKLTSADEIWKMNDVELLERLLWGRSKIPYDTKHKYNNVLLSIALFDHLPIELSGSGVEFQNKKTEEFIIKFTTILGLSVSDFSDAVSFFWQRDILHKEGCKIYLIPKVLALHLIKKFLLERNHFISKITLEILTSIKEMSLFQSFIEQFRYLENFTIGKKFIKILHGNLLKKHESTHNIYIKQLANDLQKSFHVISNSLDHNKKRKESLQTTLLESSSTTFKKIRKIESHQQSKIDPLPSQKSNN